MGILGRALGAAITLVAIGVSNAQAAKIDPPTIALGRPTTSVVVAEFKEAGPGDRLVFEHRRTLRSPGDVPALIDIGKPDLLEPMRVGESYVLAYTMYQNDPLKRTVTNLRGAIFLSTPGLEPALWKAGPEIEQLVLWSIGDDADAVRAALPRLLDLLRSPDAQVQAFAAAEITFRPALLHTLDASTQRALQRFVVNARAPAAARARLLLAALEMPASGRAQRGWDRAALGVLRDEPVRTRERRGHSELVLDAFRYLEQRDIAADRARLQRWLASDEAALAEAALLALRRQSADAEQSALAQALERDDLPATTRKFLLEHRQRLESSASRN